MVALASTLSLPSSRSKTALPARTLAATEEAVHDAELTRRFNLGDARAFVEIVTRYRGKIFAIALNHLRNHADAEEITQDTFIRAHRGLGAFRGDSSLATWLHRIAFNLSCNRYKYYACRRRSATLSLDCAVNDGSAATFSDLIASEAPDPARSAAAGEFSELVTCCMAKLGTRQREILLLRNSLNQSYGEIARALGIGIGTVKSRIARARENLRALLTEAYSASGTEHSPSWFDPVRPTGRVTAA